MIAEMSLNFLVHPYLKLRESKPLLPLSERLVQVTVLYPTVPARWQGCHWLPHPKVTAELS